MSIEHESMIDVKFTLNDDYPQQRRKNNYSLHRKDKVVIIVSAFW